MAEPPTGPFGQARAGIQPGAVPPAGPPPGGPRPPVGVQPPGGPQPPRGRGIAGPLMAVLVVGLALGVGAGALLFRSDDKKKSTAAPAAVAVDKRPVVLPASLAGFGDVTAVTALKDPKGPIAQQRNHQAKVKALTEAAYSKAFGGAAAGYRGYSDDGLLKMPRVVAVRANAPGLTIGPVADPAYLRLATPPEEVRTIGAVQCDILWSPPALQGQTPDPKNQNVVRCQRTGSGVTVFTSGSSFSGPADLQAMVNVTNDAWSAVSGG